MDDLKNELRKIRPEVPKTLKSSGKLRLLKRISEQDHCILPDAVPSERVRQAIKRRLFTRIEQYQPSIFVRICAYVFDRKLIAGVLTTAFALSLIQIIVPKPITIQAQNKTVVRAEKGEVLVQHPWDQNYFPVFGETTLHPGDKIITGPSGIATIYFFDNSLIRLTPETEIAIQKLDKHPYIEKAGVIDLKLIKGSTWNKALQVEDEFSQFSIETKSGFVSAHHATFVINANEDTETQITSLEKSVEVTLFDKGEKNVLSKTRVEEGYKAKFPSQPEKTRLGIKVATIAPIPPDTQEDTWVQENIEKDKIHIEALQESTTKILTQKETFVDSILETSPQINTQKSKNKNLHSDFVSALNDIQDGDKESAKLNLLNYRKHITQVLKDSEDEAFKTSLKNDLIAQEKEFLTLSPDSDFYILKSTIQEIREDIIEHPESDNSIKSSTAIAYASPDGNLETVILRKVEGNELALLPASETESEEVDIPRVDEVTFTIASLNLKRDVLEDENIETPSDNEKTEEDPHAFPLVSEESLKLFAENAELRKQERISQNVEHIVKKVKIYKNRVGQKNMLLAEIRRLNENPILAENKNEILKGLLSRLPVHLRSTLKEGMR